MAASTSTTCQVEAPKSLSLNKALKAEKIVKQRQQIEAKLRIIKAKENLIREIRVRPVIWDRKLVGNRQRPKIYGMWVEISKKVHQDELSSKMSDNLLNVKLSNL